MEKINKYKKIGILTLNAYQNYGNRLQAYALQKTIKNLGFYTDILIINNSTDYKNNNKTRKIIKPTKKNIKIILKKIKKKYLLYKKTKNTKKIKIASINFSREYLSEVYYNDDKKSLKELSSNYDFFITGSDQVWNPSCLANRNISLYFLTFANKDKRIAYAPSFGASNVPSEYNKNYKKWLSGIKNISVRERAGARIIKNLIGINPPVLVDPTLMLSKKDWLSVSKVSVFKPRDSYILTYFVQGTSKEIENKVKNFSAYCKLKTISIANPKDKKRLKTDPGEFIDYINSSKLVLTDSFHGVIFSIIMGVPFIVFERNDKPESRFSRIDTLLKKFKLENRKIENIDLNDKIFDINFSHVQPILECERNKATNFLKEALKIYDK
jgi:hypothetical protein